MAVQDTDKMADRTPVIQREVRDPNRDPISGAKGAHPVGVGVGAAAGGAAGALAGSVVPGVGTVIGAAIGLVVGAVGGGYAGKGIAEVIDPTEEDRYWRDNLPRASYYNSDYNFEDDYGPAYGLGYASRSTRLDSRFDDAEPEMRERWESIKGKSRLEWDQARQAVADAWHRYDNVHKDANKTKRTGPDLGASPRA